MISFFFRFIYLSGVLFTDTHFCMKTVSYTYSPCPVTGMGIDVDRGKPVPYVLDAKAEARQGSDHGHV